MKREKTSIAIEPPTGRTAEMAKERFAATGIPGTAECLAAEEAAK